jgi:hypothetical protein
MADMLTARRVPAPPAPAVGSTFAFDAIGTRWCIDTEEPWHCCVRRKQSGKTAGMRIRPRPAPVSRSAFAGFRFPPDVIVLAVRWYLRFGLSYRDVEELLTERGIKVDHVTVYRWVQRFTPLLAEAARPCRHAVGDRWWVDEIYVKVAGRWCYAYRAIDSSAR